MTCSSCGNRVADGVAFCPVCGTATGRPATHPVLPTVQLPPNKSVLLVIFLTLITASLYMPFWILNRRRTINQFYGRKAIGAFSIVLIIVFFAIELLLDIATDPTTTGVPRGSSMQALIALLRLSGGVMFLVATFRVRRYLLDYVGYPTPEGANVNPVWTFLLQVWYLQYKINRLKEGPAGAPKTVPLSPEPVRAAQ